MFYGWGKKSKDWAMSDGMTVVAVSRYLSLMFIPVTISTKWMLLNNDRSQDQEVSRSDLVARYSDDAPSLNIFGRFALLFAVAALLVFAGISSLF